MVRPSRVERANRIFWDALNIPAAERRDFVRKASDGDADMDKSLLGLLDRFERGAGSFLERAAFASADESRQELRVGSLLGRRFRIVDMLGRGGMGEVYRAEDTLLKEIVAIKTVRLEWRNDSSMIERLQDELRIARRVSHSNICRIFDLFTGDENDGGEIVFFTMECLDGDSLADVLLEQERLKIEAVLEIASGIAAGLDAAAEVGIIHRDLKPSNIILVPNRKGGWRPVITDFGLARSVEAGIRPRDAGLLAGTPHYMSPEQFSQKELTPASDIFSFGMIAYEMASGRRPYPDSDDLNAMALRRSVEDAIPLRDVMPEAPKRWERALARALSRRPEDRPATAGEVIREMQGYERQRSVPRRTFFVSAASSLGMAAFWVARRYAYQEPAATPVIMLTPLKSTGEENAGQVVLLQIEKGLLQSAQVSVLSDGEIEKAWRSLGKNNPVPKALSNTQLRQIAMRAGAGFVLTGTANRTPGTLTLDMHLETMSSHPDFPRREQPFVGRAGREQDVLPLITDLTEWVRRTVGESASEVAARSRPPQDVTTPNWDALKDYAAAEQAWRAKPQNGEWQIDQRQAAERNLQAALKKDPIFALAAGRLGDIQVASGEYDEGLRNQEKAIQLIEERNLSDREALDIRGMFAADTLQFTKAEETYERYTREYPNEALGFFYLASAAHSQGRLDEALHTIQHAISLSPGAFNSFYTNQAAWYLEAGRIADAAQANALGRRLHPSDWTDQLECALSFARMDAAGVKAALQHMRAKGSLAFRSKVFLLEACWLAERGKAEEAEELLQEGLRFDTENGQPLTVRVAKIESLAKLSLRRGHAANAIEYCKEILDTKPELRLRMAAGALLARAGDLDGARQCIPTGLSLTPPERPPKTLPAGARAEWLAWPLYWRRILLLWAEIAMAQSRPEIAFRLVCDMPPSEYRTEWPETLVRASLASGERKTAQFWLRALAANPAGSWVWPEVSGPGFIREASAWARGIGSSAGDWAKLQQFLEQPN